MRLLQKDSSPIGGFFFNDELLGRNVFTQGNFKNLVDEVIALRIANDLNVPETISQEIEDQICSRQPKGKCRMGVGDKVAKVIQTAARAVDVVAGTQLEKKAKGCKGCRKRKVILNDFYR